MVNKRSPHYTIYILRSWAEEPASAGEPPAWRFSLENPQTKARRGFNNFTDLTAFLATQLGRQVAEKNK